MAAPLIDRERLPPPPPTDAEQRAKGIDQLRGLMPPPSTPSAPSLPQFAPGYSPIAFNPADGLPNPLKSAMPGAGAGAGAGESSAIRIIALGVRKGVYEGLYDFWQSMKAMGGAKPPGGSGGITPASYEPAGGPGAGAGGLVRPGGVTPGGVATPAPGAPAVPAVPSSGGSGIGPSGLGPGAGGHGGGAGLGIGLGAIPGRAAIPAGPAGAIGEAVRGQPVPTGVPYTPGDITKTMGISPEQYRAFSEGVAQVEHARYGQMGGAGGRFAGRYQMGGAEITETAAQLHEPRPSTQQFLGDPKMQERFMEAYSAEHYRELMREPKFQALSQAQKLEMMGYAHNQGVGGALHYLRSGQAGRDAFGTSGAAYFEPIKKRLDALAKEPPAAAPKPFAGLATPAPTPGPLAQDRHDLAKHGQALREMFGHRGPQRGGGQEVMNDRQPGALWRKSRQAEAAVHKVTGEASLRVSLASGLKPEGGIRSTGDLFKKIVLDKAARPVASTVG